MFVVGKELSPGHKTVWVLVHLSLEPEKKYGLIASIPVTSKWKSNIA